MYKSRFPQLEILNVHEIVACFLIVFLVMFQYYMISPKEPYVLTPVKENSVVIKKVDPFENISLSAKAALVWDIKNQKTLYALNADEPRALASLTKVMTALTADTLIPYYTVITINNEALKEEGDSGLFGNERWKLKDLLDFSLLVSSNDGARAIAAVAGSVQLGTQEQTLGREGFINTMNQKAKEIGLTQTHFLNENGVDVGETLGGAYGTATDMAKLFEYILMNHPNLLEATRYKSLTFTSLSNLKHTGQNTNTKTGEIPGLIASKTGFTDISGGNLVVAFNPELSQPIIVVVLGSTYDGRFEDVHSLVSATLVYIKQ